MTTRKKLRRNVGVLPYRKIFVISSEGTTTEKKYFSLLRNLAPSKQIKFLSDNKGSSPERVLARMRNYLQQNELRRSDQAWIVVDKDDWSNNQLNGLTLWSLENNSFGLALSNPKFEYWLLLHFEDGHGISSPKDCDYRLNSYLPNFAKNDSRISEKVFTNTRIRLAIKNAKQRDIPPCTDWPRQVGTTTVYKLVEEILK